MASIEITDEYVRKLKQQFARWKTFLNMGTGLVSFTLALASLGTHTPALNAFLSMVVVLCIRIYGKDAFPAEITELRKKAKYDLNAKILLDGVMQQFMGPRTLLLEYTIFLIGFILLSIIIVGPLVAWVMEIRYPSVSAAVRWYVYGS